MHIFSWYTTDDALFDYRQVFSSYILRLKKIFEGDLFFKKKSAEADNDDGFIQLAVRPQYIPT